MRPGFPIFIVIPWLIVQMVLTGFGTKHKKGGPEEPPRCHLLSRRQNTPT
jgi:hypothetical protein